MSGEPESSVSDSDILKRVTDSVPAMLAYWDASERCRFASRSYEAWFGVQPASLIGTTLQQLLGPIYPLNLPFIEGVLRGERQEFEREIPHPGGGPARHGQAVYTPDIADGRVRGFSVLVTDITQLKRTESELRAALARVKTLTGLLPVCAWCSRIRDNGAWTSLEEYVVTHSDARITHGMCETCFAKSEAEGAEGR